MRPARETLSPEHLTMLCWQVYRSERPAPKAAALHALPTDKCLLRELQRLLTWDALHDTPALVLTAAELLGEGLSPRCSRGVDPCT